MNFYDFEDLIIEYVSKEFEKKGVVKVADVKKNNGIILRGLTVWFTDAAIVPTLYIEDMYEDFKKGRSIKDICENVRDVFNNANRTVDIDVSFLNDYDKVKKRLFFKLINTEKNRELLESVPHLDYLDLSVVFYILVLNNEEIGSVLLNNTLFEKYNVSIEEMIETAKMNNRNLLKMKFSSLREIFENMLLSESDKSNSDILEELNYMDEDSRLCMYVLSNERSSLGAAFMFDEDILYDISHRISSDFYILPSSIHELILIPERGDEDVETLKEMVREVNRTQVAPGEVLSDSVYKYVRNNRLVMQA